MRVLIIDDEELIRKCFYRIACSKGHKALHVGAGKQGLKMWQEFQPHLVFLDVLIPDIDGPSLLQRVGKHNNEKVVMMSAHKAFSAVAKIPGVDLFVPKPFKDIVAVFEQGERLSLSPKSHQSSPTLTSL